MRLGELLVSKCLISEDQLLKGLSRHFRHHEKLGECLILEGAITESDLLGALSEQLGLPFFQVIPTELITKESLSIIPKANAKRWCAIAGQDNNGFIVFFNDNFEEINVFIKDNGLSAGFGLVKKSEIRKAINIFIK